MIFIHIPKTAGTSFRLGASRYFGQRYELRDYGKDVRATSPLVNEFVHQRNDVETFRKKVDQLGIKFITGHFPSQRYLPYFDKGTFVAFVRDPVQRVVSEYRHAVRLNGETEPLSVFCRRPVQTNRQWKFLKAIGINNMAFVGITEQYERSVARINTIFGTHIPLLRKNVGKQRIEEEHRVVPEDARLIQRLNTADLDLYEAVKTCFGPSAQPQPAIEETCFCGDIGGLRNGKIVGWAVNRCKEVPVEVSIFINGSNVGHTLANRFRPDLKKAGIKRSGCCGIVFDLNTTFVSRGDKIEFREKESGLLIGQTVVGN